MTLDDLMAWMNGAGMSSDPGRVNAISGATGFASGILRAGSQLAYGSQTAAAEGFRATQLRQGATATLAAGTRQARDQQLETQMVESKALAAAAASGGGASDPTVVNILSRIASEGAYRTASAIYSAQDTARVMQEQADAAQYEGKVAKNNSRIAAVGSLMQGGASLALSRARGQSLYDRYAGPSKLDGGPGTSGWGMDLGRD